jgi:hypothetical protein
MIKKSAVPAVIGLAFAVTTTLIGMAMTGAGHGWITPFFFSFAGFALFPIAFARFVFATETRMGTNIALIAVAVILDVWLLVNTLEEGLRYFHKVGVFAYVWLALWSIWQIAFVLTAVRRRKSVAA